MCNTIPKIDMYNLCVTKIIKEYQSIPEESRPYTYLSEMYGVVVTATIRYGNSNVVDVSVYHTRVYSIPPSANTAAYFVVGFLYIVFGDSYMIIDNLNFNRRI